MKRASYAAITIGVLFVAALAALALIMPQWDASTAASVVKSQESLTLQNVAWKSTPTALELFVSLAIGLGLGITLMSNTRRWEE